ncbi:hypothetical protein CEP54_014073 [Fusarium duplospermum]|uniref:Uncharacterized protein n=1 Tax=Fusarium duplospermum TaxID=1325734 RepID=A0A428NZ27_9HYPO|nr:hypothetical protein CEP54_014073 [Fusarium duplospermum]
MSNTTPQSNTPNRESSSKENLYTTATPIRFASRSTGGDVLMLDPRNVQQWQLDAYEARLDEQMAKYKDRVQELESLIENKTGDQTAVKDELEMLKGELGKISQKKKKGGCFPWKTCLVVLLAVVFFSSYAGDGYAGESIF